MTVHVWGRKHQCFEQFIMFNNSFAANNRINENMDKNNENRRL